VTDISSELYGSSMLKNVVNERWLIIDTHLLEIEVPILFLSWRILHVLVRVEISTVVSKPHIVPCVCKDECRCKLWRVKNPLHRAIFDAMLQQ